MKHCKQDMLLSKHDIDRLVLANEWKPSIKASELPITVEKHLCMKCGHWKASIYSNEKLINKSEGKISYE